MFTDDLKKWAWRVWIILILLALVYFEACGGGSFDLLKFFVKPRLTYPEDP